LFLFLFCFSFSFSFVLWNDLIHYLIIPVLCAWSQSPRTVVSAWSQSPRTVALGITVLSILEPASAVLENSSHPGQGTVAMGVLAKAAAAFAGGVLLTAVSPSARTFTRRRALPCPDHPTKEQSHSLVHENKKQKGDDLLKDDDPCGFVGKNIKRFFDGVASMGVVVGWYPPEEPGDGALWHVSYEDGDEEDLDEAECTAAITEADEDPYLTSSKKKARKENMTAGGPKKPKERTSSQKLAHPKKLPEDAPTLFEPVDFATVRIGSVVELTYEGAAHPVVVINRTAKHVDLEFLSGDYIRLSSSQFKRSVGKLVQEGPPPSEGEPKRWGKKRKHKRPASPIGPPVPVVPPEEPGAASGNEAPDLPERERLERVHDEPRSSEDNEGACEPGYEMPFMPDFDDDLADIDTTDGSPETAAHLPTPDRLSPEAISAGLGLMQMVFQAAQKEHKSRSEAPTPVEVRP
jgi:hypothetical protein